MRCCLVVTVLVVTVLHLSTALNTGDSDTDGRDEMAAMDRDKNGIVTSAELRYFMKGASRKNVPIHSLQANVFF